MIKQITSVENSLVKRVVQLHSLKYRKKYREFIAEGFRTISTLIAAGSKLITLFTTEEFLYDAQQIANHNDIVVVSDAVLKKMSCAVTPSGLLATYTMPQQPSLDTLTAGIVLAQVSDPGNMGTLIRTAAAMNKTTVVCIETVDPWNPKVVQASAGALGHVSIFCIDWDDVVQHKKDLNLCALVASEGKNPDTVNLKNALIVVGNEGAGIPHTWVAQCDEKITLPMPGNFESLNAAVAGSIALYLAAK
jgi:RNA methyltransferase, TrmH family